MKKEKKVMVEKHEWEKMDTMNSLFRSDYEKIQGTMGKAKSGNELFTKLDS